ncbi:MAG: hypothetical protein ACYCWW_10840 [Deltaproteobacteria bacterium]
MTTLRSALLSALALSFAPLAKGQLVELRLPSIRFEAPPPLVEVEPGVQVVPERDEEVFYARGWYWTRRGDRWYRARDHRGGWQLVEHRVVPVQVARIPPGRYRHWHREERRERDGDRGDRGDRGRHGGHDRD